MRNQKNYIAIDEYERRIIIYSLNNLRNKLIEEGRYTDAVDDALIKVVNAPIRKFKVKVTEVRLWRKQFINKLAELTLRKTGILSPILHCRPKKKSLSGYGDNGTCGILRSIKG